MISNIFKFARLKIEVKIIYILTLRSIVANLTWDYSLFSIKIETLFQ